MKTTIWKCALVGLLAIASRVQADEGGTSSDHREAARLATAPAQTVALPLAPSESTGVEGDSNSGAMAPDIGNVPQAPCPDTGTAQPSARIGAPTDDFARQVWSGP